MYLQRVSKNEEDDLDAPTTTHRSLPATSLTASAVVLRVDLRFIRSWLVDVRPTANTVLLRSPIDAAIFCSPSHY